MMHTKTSITLFLSLLKFITCFKYPKAYQSNTTEIFHNKHVVDNKYDWLEDPKSEETIKFIDEQNELTYGFLETFPTRDELRKSIALTYNYTRYINPFRGCKKDYCISENSWYFYKKLPSENHWVLYKLDDIND